MQTFLPYPDFEASAKCLDYRRLGKQRVEAKQILDILLNRTDKKGWRNHPAVKMWNCYILALQEYYNTIVKEWISRGYKNNMPLEMVKWKWHGTEQYFTQEPRYHPFYCLPAWLTEEFCSRHRAALLYKMSEWYGQFGWTEEAEINYIWPSQAARA